MKRSETPVITPEAAFELRKLLRASITKDSSHSIVRARPFPRAGYGQKVFDLCRRPNGCSRKERFAACAHSENARIRIEDEIKRQMRDGWEWKCLEDEEFIGQLRVYSVKLVKR